MGKFIPATNITIIICLAALSGVLFYINQDTTASMVVGGLLMFVKSE